MHAMEGDERQLCVSLANYFPQLFYVFLCSSWSKQ